MGLFFDAGKYLTRVESPRINTTKDRRDQINDYIVRYFKMYPHDYIQKAQFVARIYVNEILPDEAGSPGNLRHNTGPSGLSQKFAG